MNLPEAPTKDSLANWAIGIVALLVANYLQSRSQRKKLEADAKVVKTAATAASETLDSVKQEVGKVYQTLNGSGLLGAVKKVLENQGEHETKDEERFKELTDRLTDVETAVGLPPKMDRRSNKGRL